MRPHLLAPRAVFGLDLRPGNSAVAPLFCALNAQTSEAELGGFELETAADVLSERAPGRQPDEHESEQEANHAGRGSVKGGTAAGAGASARASRHSRAAARRSTTIETKMTSQNRTCSA